MIFLDKKRIKNIFCISSSTKLNDDDHIKYCKFLTGTITGSFYEIEEWMDFVVFNNNFKPQWDKLYKRFEEKKLINQTEWACFDVDKLEFVDFKTQKINESFNYPNEYSRKN